MKSDHTLHRSIAAGWREASGVSGSSLLDGGMGQELVERSGDAPTALWATRVMIDRPGLVREIHDECFPMRSRGG